MDSAAYLARFRSPRQSGTHRGRGTDAHLLDAARPGPTTPMGVQQDLAADLKSDLVGEMFVSEEISWILERESDASAN